MKYTETGIGRIFVLRLESGDEMPAVIEEFAAAKQIKRGLCFFLGGADKGSKLVEGPIDKDAVHIEPIIKMLDDAHEILGLGTIFPDIDDKPILHAHASAGRDGKSETGCIRPGVKTWLVGEVVIVEFTGLSGRRLPDPLTGFSLLSFIKDPETA